jgi:hypothetical protein
MKKPIKKKGVPVQGDGVPVQGDGVPVQGDGVPVQGDGVPVQGDGVPVQGDGVTAQRKATRATDLQDDRGRRYTVTLDAAHNRLVFRARFARETLEIPFAVALKHAVIVKTGGQQEAFALKATNRLGTVQKVPVGSTEVCQGTGDLGELLAKIRLAVRETMTQACTIAEARVAERVFPVMKDIEQFHTHP